MIKSPDARRRRDRSRKATLDAAVELCAELGYGAMTVDAIAKRAGVSKATIYRWWPSKGAILLDAIDEAGLVPRPAPDTGELVADLRTQLMRIAAVFTDERLGPAFTGVLAESQLDRELAKEVRERLIEPRVAQLHDRMRRAQEQGQLAGDVDLDIAVELLHAPLYRRHVLGYPLPGADRLDQLIHHVFRALTPT